MNLRSSGGKFSRAAALLLAALPPAGAATPGTAALTAWLQGHAEPLELGGGERTFRADLLATTGQRLILLGEVHGVAWNNDVDLALLRYLHRQAGVRTYLAEISHAQACLLNRYLASGDERELDFIFAQMLGRTVDCSVEKRQFWVALRAWNHSLPVSEQIQILGIDLERFPGISLGFLADRLSDPSTPPAWRALAPEVAATAAHPTNAAVQTLVEHLFQAGVREPSRGPPGPNPSADLALVVENLSQRVRCAADHAHYDERRDAAMASNFRRLTSQPPPGPIYGRIGFAHVLQHGFDGTSWLSADLNSPNSPWAGHICGIWPVYQDCRRLGSDAGRYHEVACTDATAEAEPLARAAKTDLTLFRLDGPDSPFQQVLSIPGGGEGGATTDYVQYALLFRNAPPDTPWRPPSG